MLSLTMLSTTRTADIYCDYMTGSISTGNLSVSSNGTTVASSGTKACKINNKSGTYWFASFTDFFTTTTPPVITVI